MPTLPHIPNRSKNMVLASKGLSAIGPEIKPE
jgi:hypothetical protein